MTAALILVQARMICESGNAPILLLDDLSSELDEEHHSKVLRAGMNLGVQIWLTGTGLSSAVLECSDVRDNGLAVFHVEHGIVSRVKAPSKKAG